MSGIKEEQETFRARALRVGLLTGLCALAAVAGGTLAPAEAKKIARHCDAKYVWETTGGTFSGSFGHFKGRGGCGSAVPNRCRQRARDYAMRCMGTHVATRWQRERPEVCYPPSGVLGYNLGISPCTSTSTNTCHSPKAGVPKGDIKQRLEVEVCCGFNSTKALRDDKKVHVRLKGVVTGDKDCGSTKTFFNDYVIHDCSAVWKKYCKQ